ncbi:MAG: toprim domain-containing protein [Thermoplasmata archaeon]|nr:toprim domain-containing protein [Thermoplasmata archaeon]
MMRTPQETLDDLKAVIEELANQEDVPIIVEGRKDEQALRELGITGPVVVLNDGLSTIDTCTKLSGKYKKAVILTDWDRKGGQLARQLMDALEANDMHYNTDIRATISRLSKKDIKDVESLPSFLRRLEEKASGHSMRH